MKTDSDCKALAKPNNIGDYRVVLVVDGDSKGGLTIDLEGTLFILEINHYTVQLIIR